MRIGRKQQRVNNKCINSVSFARKITKSVNLERDVSEVTAKQNAHLKIVTPSNATELVR